MKNQSLNQYKTIGNRRVYNIQKYTIIDSSFIRDRVRRFFRTTNFGSRYILLIIKINAFNKSFWRSKGYRTIIDLDNRKSIDRYISDLLIYTNTDGDVTSWYNGLSPDQLIFEWINTNQTQYNKYIKRMDYQTSRNISENLDIPKYNKLPWNTYYNTWGSMTKPLDDKNRIISIFYFGSTIENILVKDLNDNNTEITIKYINGRSITFIDNRIGL